MSKKLYLSAAAHQYDNVTRCPIPCGENVHCNAYMDLVEERMKALGVEVKRGDPDKTGSIAMHQRVAEANRWGADLYYVAHTNAGGGRYSMTMCWGDADSKLKAGIIGKYRKSVKVHKVKVRTDLYEIRATQMPCLYDELFFHDNAEDCAWFHGGGMAQMAEETVQALCELLAVTYVAPVTQEKVPVAGDKVVLKKEKLYLASVGSAGVVRSGTYYLYDGKNVKGRYRVTNKKSRVGKKPLATNVSGWVEL